MKNITPDQPDRTALGRLRDMPELAAVAAEILWHANRANQGDAFLGAALAILSAETEADYAAVVAAGAGRWTVLGEVGRPQSLPVDLLAEVLDRESARAHEAWAAAPLFERAIGGELLVLHVPSADPAKTLAAGGRLAGVLGEGLTALRDRNRQSDRREQRLRRLEAIVRIAQQWNRCHEVEPLLIEMAEAATQLLGADRASIFLWDRPSGTLVGRPALGVEDGELRIPDNAGVVGRVVRSGRPERVNAAVEPDRIDHQVDTRLGYQTLTVLCVPLRGGSGELFGAFEILNKHSGGFSAEDEAAAVELAAHAATALENAQDRQRLLSTSRRIADEAAQGVRLVGQSPAIEAMRSIIRRVADTDLTVLILGENGTGKEVVAQSIHYLSRRRDKPFVAVNCAAIPDTLSESELFGHEKGAFTDAREARPGKFELAADGTLLLDEIGDLSPSGQAKLLRVLEEKVLVRLGGSTPVRADARVLAASNQDLAEMVRQKRFRQDLYFRLNVVTIEMPPLRDRVEDVMLLAGHFLDDFCKKARRKAPRFSAAARRRLESHPWPGNVRELRNLMERLAYLSSEDRIEAEDLAFILAPQGDRPLVGGTDRTLSAATAEFQVETIRQAIDQYGGNLSQAAARLGLHRSNLYRKMRQLGMDTTR